MILRRAFPGPALAPFVEFFWYYDGWEGTHSRERVLPDGSFELVINLRDGPRRLFDRNDPSRSASFRRGWLSGTHSQHILIDTVPGASMIGAHFRPGGAQRFLGFPAAELQDRVVEFDAIWGSRARELQEQLWTAPDPAARFRQLERFLSDQLNRCRVDQPRREKIVWAIEQFCRQPHLVTIKTVAGHLGVSHKHFIQLFREQAGLTPKLFCRIRRFQQVLVGMHAPRRSSWADIAASCGYYDQAHFINDFQAFAGISPSLYSSLGQEYASFVPVDGDR
jgi:AraC-like DNA-binding protein